uniref:Uncharacterized protein n=1 Tax=Zea mays TaxID=4577 RepID=C0PLQ4_MAIZE|nr:unknown [Zea mays]ACR37149.1 unknown [Zea mays]
MPARACTYIPNPTRRGFSFSFQPLSICREYRICFASRRCSCGRHQLGQSHG